jgi:RNase P protein component
MHKVSRHRIKRLLRLVILVIKNPTRAIIRFYTLPRLNSVGNKSYVSGDK